MKKPLRFSLGFLRKKKATEEKAVTRITRPVETRPISDDQQTLNRLVKQASSSKFFIENAAKNRISTEKYFNIKFGQLLAKIGGADVFEQYEALAMADSAATGKPFSEIKFVEQLLTREFKPSGTNPLETIKRMEESKKSNKSGDVIKGMAAKAASLGFFVEACEAKSLDPKETFKKTVNGWKNNEKFKKKMAEAKMAAKQKGQKFDPTEFCARLIVERLKR